MRGPTHLYFAVLAPVCLSRAGTRAIDSKVLRIDAANLSANLVFTDKDLVIGSDALDRCWGHEA